MMKRDFCEVRTLSFDEEGEDVPFFSFRLIAIDRFTWGRVGIECTAHQATQRCSRDQNRPFASCG